MATTYKKNENGTYNVPCMGEIFEKEMISVSDFNKTLTPYILNKFIPDFYGFLCKYFKKETIETVINEFRYGDILSWDYIPVETGILKATLNRNDTAITYDHPSIHPITEYNKGWERKVDKMCLAITYKNKYDFYSGKMFKRCLEIENPWMKNFILSEFSLSNYQRYENELVFLTIPEIDVKGTKSVYIPISALLTHDVSAIVKKHTDYFNEYYNWNSGSWGKGVTKEDVEGWRNDALSLLKSNTFKSFAKFLEKGGKINESEIKNPIQVVKVKYVATVVLEEEIKVNTIKQDVETTIQNFKTIKTNNLKNRIKCSDFKISRVQCKEI